MAVVTTGGTGVSPSVAQFLGFTESFKDEFQLKIENFIIDPWRSDFLSEYLTKQQEVFEALYRISLKIKDVLSYDKSPDIFLKYIDGLLSLLPKDIRDLNDLSVVDHRRLLRNITELWRYNGTPTGYVKILDGFTRRPTRVLQWPYWKTILDEAYLGYDRIVPDSWILTDSGPPPDTYWTYLSVVDEGGRTLNRRLIEDLVKLNMNAAEWVTIRWLYFLDTADSLEQFYILSGTTGWPKSSGGKIEFSTSSFIRSDVIYDDFWKDYAVQVKLNVPQDGIFRICFLLQDADNYYYLEINQATKTATIGIVDHSVNSVITTITPDSILHSIDYMWSVDINTTDNRVDVYQDGVPIGYASIGVPVWTEGRIGLLCVDTGAVSEYKFIDEVEVYRIFKELDPSHAEYGKDLITRVGPDMLVSPSVFTMSSSGTQDIKMIGGFGDYSVSSTGGSLSTLNLISGVFHSTYTAPASPGTYVITVKDKYGDTATAKVTVV